MSPDVVFPQAVSVCSEMDTVPGHIRRKVPFFINEGRIDVQVIAALLDIAINAPIINKVKEAGALRTITMGVNKVAEEPVDEDFEQAAVYTIDLPAVSGEGRLLNIEYRGDVARLYADGQLIDDNFYNGRPFQYALWRLPKECKQLELRILPLQKDMPVYFPREADTTPGEQVMKVTIINQ